MALPVAAIAITNLVAGVTHDVVIQVNNSIQVGLIIEPGSYRVQNAPSFIPKFAVGDPSGLDYTRWRSFVQQDFSGGAGQYFYSGQRGNNKFAASSLIDVGLQPRVIGVRPVTPSWVNIRTGVGGGWTVGPPTPPGGGNPDYDESATGGAFTVALAPRATTAESSFGPTLWTQTLPVWAVQFSNTPMAFHRVWAGVYTNLTDIVVLSPFLGDFGLRSGWLSGKWATISSALPPQVSSGVISAAVLFSNVVMVAMQGNGVRVFGSSNGVAPSFFYTPTYNTVSDLLQPFTGKLFRTRGHQLSYLDLSVVNNSVDARWTVYQDVGDPTSIVRRTAILGGRMYLGKDDGLWVYDNGRVFPIVDYSSNASQYNFSCMAAFHNLIYYNIGSRLYSISTSGQVTPIRTPTFHGTIVSGAFVGNVLHFIVRTPFGDGEVWIYDPTLDACYQWFSTKEVASRVDDWSSYTSPSSVIGVAGWVLVAPLTQTNTIPVSQTMAAAPISMAFRGQPAVLTGSPYYYSDGAASRLITSFQNFGMPGLNKLFNRVVVDYKLNNSSESILVYYSDTAPTSRVAAVLTSTDGTTFVDRTTKMTDGKFAPTNVADDTLWTELTGIQVNGQVDFGFTLPVDQMSLQVYQNVNTFFPVSASVWEYWNGSAWVALPDVMDGTVMPFTLAQPASTGSRMRVNGNVTWQIPGDWATTTVGGLGPYYYIRLRSTVASGTLEMYESTAIAHPVFDAVPWRLLGTITNNDVTRASLSFPEGTQATEMALRFVLRATSASRPELSRYQIEWTPVGPHRELKRVTFNVMALNNMEILKPGVVENSAHFIHASLWSMNGAGIAYIAQIPYPPPVASTIRTLVTIADPGVHVPILSYGHTLGGPDGALIEAKIPVVLDEM